MGQGRKDGTEIHETWGPVMVTYHTASKTKEQERISQDKEQFEVRGEFEVVQAE